MLSLGIGIGVSLAQRVGDSAPSAPVLTAGASGDGTIAVSWTNTGADTYRLYVGGALAQPGLTGTTATATGLTNFQDYNITVRAVVGGVESADSNTVTAYPTYGPVTIPVGETTLTLHGDWTVGMALWGTASLPTGTVLAADFNGTDYETLYEYIGGGSWEDVYLGGSGTDNAVSGQVVVQNSSGSSFIIWAGRPVLLLLGILTSIAVATTVGSASDFTVEDRLMHHATGASTALDFEWPWTSALTNTVVAEVTRESSNPSVIVPSSTDPYRWTFVSAGTATLIMRTQSATYAVSVTTTTGTGTVDTVTGFATGSLRKHIGDVVDAALAGKTASTGLPMFSTQDHSTPAYVRNVDCWGAGFAGALTAITPWNSQLSVFYSGILVSPRHVIFATHFMPMPGAVLRFITATNVVVERTLSSLTSLSQTEAYYPDLSIGKLDSDVPGTIAFARVLPSDWASKLPSLNSYPVLCANTDQEEHLHLRELSKLPSSTSPRALVNFRKPVGTLRGEFYEDVVSGDSGNPAFLIINGQLVLLTVWTSGGSGAGTSVYAFKSAINATMASLGGGYSLTDADLSSFTSY